jgi:hypothetical protein
MDFGIIEERLMKTKKAKRVGVLVLSLCALAGVTSASNMRQLLLGQANSAPMNETKFSAAATPQAQTTVNSNTVNTTEAQETANAAPNIVDLISDSELIVSGMVKDVTDGFENGLPYTQVTIEVSEALRGQVGEEYTFRQFGLKEPRRMENGKIYLGVTPAGWAKYEVGEQTMLFLHQAASVTGLRTTAGLGQGKVVFKGGNAVSQADNEGLFDGVEVNANLLNDRDKRLLATKGGAVNAEGFKSLVKRAVNGKWIEGGKMRHVKK